MKLIELLARELKEWPSDKDTHAWQDYDSMEIRFNYNIAGDFVATERADDCQRRCGEPHPNDPSGYVTREQWGAARHAPTTPTLETMLAEWRDLESRAQAAQTEADALFEHAGQCHGEIVVRLAELGWGAPRGPMVPGEPVVTLDDNDGWIEWGGGECPVENGTRIDTKYRNGSTEQNVPTGEPGTRTSCDFWVHEDYENDIVAYRLTPSTQP